MRLGNEALRIVKPIVGYFSKISYSTITSVLKVKTVASVVAQATSTTNHKQKSPTTLGFTYGIPSTCNGYHDRSVHKNCTSVLCVWAFNCWCHAMDLGTLVCGSTMGFL